MLIPDEREFERLAAAGYRVCLFESAERFLAIQNAEAPGCVLSDIFLPGLSGLELQRSLLRSPYPRPIVFLAATSDIQASVDAMKAGAVDFLTKPFEDERLLAAIEQALQRDRHQRLQRAVCSESQLRFETLTRRERQVMAHIICGRLNKQIAAQLGIHEKTVKVHRGRVMAKLSVRSVPALMHVASHAGVANDSPLLRQIDIESEATHPYRHQNQQRGDQEVNHENR